MYNINNDNLELIDIIIEIISEAIEIEDKLKNLKIKQQLLINKIDQGEIIL